MNTIANDDSQAFLLDVKLRKQDKSTRRLIPAGNTCIYDILGGMTVEHETLIIMVNSHTIAPIVSIADVTSKSGLTIGGDYMRTLHSRSLMPAAIRSPVFFPGDCSQTGAIVNDFMKTSFSQGDDRSDQNCPMVHQYYPELNTALQPRWPSLKQFFKTA